MKLKTIKKNKQELATARKLFISLIKLRLALNSFLISENKNKSENLEENISRGIRLEMRYNRKLIKK